MVESAKTKTRKPEPGIYQRVLNQLNMEGSETVFLDDIGENLKAAAKFGIKTIKVLSLELLKLVGYGIKVFSCKLTCCSISLPTN